MSLAEVAASHDLPVRITRPGTTWAHDSKGPVYEVRQSPAVVVLTGHIFGHFWAMETVEGKPFVAFDNWPFIDWSTP